MPSSRMGMYPYIEGITKIPCERKTIPGYFFHLEIHGMNCEPPKSKPEDAYTTFNPETRLMEAGYDVGTFWENGIPTIFGIRYRLRDLISASTWEHPGKRTYEVRGGITTNGKYPSQGAIHATMQIKAEEILGVDYLDSATEQKIQEQDFVIRLLNYPMTH